MRIERVDSGVMSVPVKEPRAYSTKTRYTNDFVYVRITCDDQASGLGVIPTNNPYAVFQFVERQMKNLMIGENPMDTEAIWMKLYREIHRERRGAGMCALSGVDIALWDLKGKLFRAPICQIIGGSRTEVPCYAAGGYFQKGKTLDGLQKEMIGYLESGYKAIKMKVGLMPLEEDDKRVRAVRDAIGGGTPLMVDANGAYGVYNAVKMGRRLERYDIGWFEEPVSPEDIDGMAEVARALDVPVAAGQSEDSRNGFRTLLEKRAVDILQHDVSVCGGITEWLKIAGVASTYGIPLAPHWDGNLGAKWDQEVNTHLGAAFSSIMYIEHLPTRLVPGYRMPKAGALPVPMSPGLGVDYEQVKPDMEKYRVPS